MHQMRFVFRTTLANQNTLPPAIVNPALVFPPSVPVTWFPLPIVRGRQGLVEGEHKQVAMCSRR